MDRQRHHRGRRSATVFDLPHWQRHAQRPAVHQSGPVARAAASPDIAGYANGYRDRPRRARVLPAVVGHQRDRAALRRLSSPSSTRRPAPARRLPLIRLLYAHRGPPGSSATSPTGATNAASGAPGYLCGARSGTPAPGLGSIKGSALLEAAPPGRRARTRPSSGTRHHRQAGRAPVFDRFGDFEGFMLEEAP